MKALALISGQFCHSRCTSMGRIFLACEKERILCIRSEALLLFPQYFGDRRCRQVSREPTFRTLYPTMAWKHALPLLVFVCTNRYQFRDCARETAASHFSGQVSSQPQNIAGNSDLLSTGNIFLRARSAVLLLLHYQSHLQI